MQTISAEEFKKKYGEAAIAQFSPVTKRPSIGEVISKNFKAGVDQTKKGFTQIGRGDSPLDLIEGFGSAGSGIINAVSSPLTPITEPTIGKGIGYVADKISDSPVVQRFADSKAGEVTSRVAEDVANYSNIAGTVGGAMKAPGAIKSVKNGIANTADTLSKIPNAFDSVLENASKYPKKIADKITLGKIDTKTQTILKESAADLFDEYVATGKKAIKDPRELTPLEIAGQKGEDVAQIIKKDLNNIGEQKSAALESVKDTKVPDIAVKQIEKVKPLLQKKLTDSERGIVTEYLNELKSLGKKPTAQSVDATIDKLQSTIYEKSKGVAIPMTTRIKSFINQSIGELNSELKSAVDKALGNDSYSNFNSLYSDKIKTFQTLNKALGEGGTKGGSLMKRFFSPQDAGVKELFAKIKKEYGVDLGANATLAKFVMDTLGDSRSKSLLELPPRSAVGIVGEVLKQVEKKLTSPDTVIKKARSLTKSSP